MRVQTKPPSPLEQTHSAQAPALGTNLKSTCEAIAAYVYPRVAARLPGGVLLERVRIMEDPTLYADCTGIP